MAQSDPSDFGIVQGGKLFKPCSPAKVREMIAAGELKKNARLWRSGLDDWLSITELFPQEFGLTPSFVTEMEERGEVPSPAEDNIYTRVQVVPAASLKQLLRERKEEADNPGDVLVSSPNKKGLIENLQEAVRTGNLEEQELETLLQEYCESGRQQIYLYERAAPAAALDFELVGKRLFGARWGKVSFPIFHHLPPRPEISSFRRYSISEEAAKVLGFSAKYAEGWILRLDATVQSEDRLSRPEADARVRLVAYANKVEDAVIVMRYWSTLGLLEVRIPHMDVQRAVVIELRDAILDQFTEAIDFPGFRPLKLAGACTSILQRLLSSPKLEPGILKAGDSFLRERDKGTMRVVVPNLGVDDLRGTPARKQSLESYLKSDSQVESLTCEVQPPGNPTSLRVIVCPRCTDAPHEFSIRKQISASALDYVVHRLHENAKPQPGPR